MRLDEPVDRLLPEFADRKVLQRLDGPLDKTVPANRPITVRNLLTFRMGFGIVMAPPGTYPDPKGRQRAAPRPGAAPTADAAFSGRVDSSL